MYIQVYTSYIIYVILKLITLFYSTKKIETNSASPLSAVKHTFLYPLFLFPWCTRANI